MGGQERNSPCHCGSGKKFKKCHGAPQSVRALRADHGSATPLPPKTVTTSVPPDGFPGQALHYAVVTVFLDGSQSRPEGSPGLYRVRFTMARRDAGNRTPDNVDCTLDLMGDSHILLPRDESGPANLPFGRLLIEQETPQGRFTFEGLPNVQGRLGLIVCECEASEHSDAARGAYGALASLMSSWSAQLDIPVLVGRILTEEVATLGLRVEHRNSYPNLSLAIEPTGQLSGEFRGFAGVYREALNSNAPAYQFLCLYKIIEAVKERRERRIKDGTALKGQKFPHERIPANKREIPAFLNALFHPRREWGEMVSNSICTVETAGQKFYSLVEKYLEPLRVAIAHALVEGGAVTLSTDEMLHLARVERWLPVTKVIARRMLKNEFRAEFLSFLGEDGLVRFDQARAEESLRFAKSVRPPRAP